MQNKINPRIAGAKKLKTKKGSKYPVNLYDNGMVECGCVVLKHSVMLKRYKPFGVKDDFTEEQLQEYEKIFQSLSESYLKYKAEQ